MSLSRFFHDERGELGPALRFLIGFVVVAFLVYNVIMVYYVKYSVVQGSKDAALAAASEMVLSNNPEKGRSVAATIAATGGNSLEDFQLRGGKVFIELKSNNELKSLSKIGVIRPYIVTTATAEAEIHRDQR